MGQGNSFRRQSSSGYPILVVGFPLLRFCEAGCGNPVRGSKCPIVQPFGMLAVVILVQGLGRYLNFEYWDP